MYKITATLTRFLGEHLTLSAARLICLSSITMSLLACESVSLRKLSLRMGGAAKPSSQYRRLQRFFPVGTV